MSDGKEKFKERTESMEKSGGDGSRYRELKKEYKEVCTRKKQEENLRWKRQIEEAKQEG